MKSPALVYVAGPYRAPTTREIGARAEVREADRRGIPVFHETAAERDSLRAWIGGWNR